MLTPPIVLAFQCGGCVSFHDGVMAEVIAAPGPVDDVELGGVGKGLLQQVAQRLRAHPTDRIGRGTGGYTAPASGCGGIGRRARFRSVCP